MRHAARPATALILACFACACADRAPPRTPNASRPGVKSPDDQAPTLRLPHSVRPIRYALDLTIQPDRPRFRGRVTISAEVRQPVSTVWLNATDLDIAGASVGGVPARVIVASEDVIGLRTGRTIQPGRTTIELHYSGAIDREKSRGIYAVQEGDEWYAYTFFEPIDARRAFPCFDQPDAKVPWQLTFHVAKDHVALANAAVVNEAPEPGGMKKVVTAESKPLPSYLVAFVVGPFEVVDSGTAGRVRTPLRFIVPRGRAGELGYARRVTPRVVAALEDYFDMDYPYGKLDVAVVPRYWGTMEHPGIVAMGQPLTLIEPHEETRDRKQFYTTILAHELAHYWFGDLVTLAWWDDTWLNEALGTWMDAIITDQAEQSWKHLERRTELAAPAMQADEKLSTKAIRQPVATKEAIQHSFDSSITYFKGATVLRMFESWVGTDKWRDFIRAYMRAFAWKNATADDFVASMGRHLGAEAAAAFRTFLDQPGVPLVEHRLVCDGAPRLELTQRRALPIGSRERTARTWQVPVCVRHGTGARSQRACTLLAAADGSLPLEGECPRWLVMNAGGVGYYRSRYNPDEVAALLSGTSPARATMAERYAILSDVGAAVARDQMPIARAMALVPAVLADRDERIQNAALTLVRALRADQLGDKDHAAYRRWALARFGPLARSLTWRRRPTDSDERQELRATAVSYAAWAGDKRLRAQADRLARAWLADRSALEDDMVEQVLAAAALDGDAALFDRVLAAARAEKDRTAQLRLLVALGSFRDPVLVDRALALVMGQGFDLRETRPLLVTSLSHRESRERAWQYIQDNVDRLFRVMRSDEAADFVGELGVFCDAKRRAEVASLLTPRVARIEGARYSLAQALDAIDQCVAVQARVAPGAIEFLARR